MLEIEQDRQRVLDDLVRFAALDVGNKSDPAGILFQRRIEQAETMTRPSSSSRFPAAAALAGTQGSRRSFLAPVRRPAPEGEPVILEATFVPLPASGCFFAAVRRALASGGRSARIFPRLYPPQCRDEKGTGRALRTTNWDSNAVLCGTWQIPGASTSPPLPAGEEKLRPCAFRLGFRQCPAAEWTTGRAQAQWLDVHTLGAARYRWAGSLDPVSTPGRKMKTKPKATNVTNAEPHHAPLHSPLGIFNRFGRTRPCCGRCRRRTVRDPVSGTSPEP